MFRYITCNIVGMISLEIGLQFYQCTLQFMTEMYGKFDFVFPHSLLNWQN